MDAKGETVMDKRTDCYYKLVREELFRMPPNTEYVPESSSVWYGMLMYC